MSLFFGGAMPLLIEGTKLFNGWIFAGAGAIFFISFYASSPSRSIPQAIGLAIAVAAVTVAFQAATSSDFFTFGRLAPTASIGLALLKLYIGVPLLVLVFGWLAFWNFKWLHQSSACFRRNAIAVVSSLVLIFVLPTSIYFRVWEYVLPLETPHGPARLGNSSEIKFSSFFNTLYTRLPDGRLWTKTLAMDYVSNQWRQADILVPARSRDEFIAGSNWDNITADSFQALGIKTDGTLWNLQRKWNPAQNRLWQTNSFIVTQIGPDTDWSQAGSGSMGFLLTKNDGSLWLWGTQNYDWRNSSSIPKKLKSDLATLPSRVGNETNWTALFTSAGFRNSPDAMKNDGTIWHWAGSTGTNFSYMLTLETNLTGPWSRLESMAGDTSFLGIKTNGSLWVVKNFGLRGQTRIMDQLGKDSQWKSVGSHWDAIYAIRYDGTLWRWSPAWNVSASSEPVQLGNQSDWVAQINAWSGNFTLAADGSLWAWDQLSRHIWLAPSRKPLYMGNIFQGSSPDP
jgi:hypothetical protein